MVKSMLTVIITATLSRAARSNSLDAIVAPLVAIDNTTASTEAASTVPLAWIVNWSTFDCPKDNLAQASQDACYGPLTWTGVKVE